jgi:hypothetical protein
MCLWSPLRFPCVVSENAGIEPRTVTTLALTVMNSNHSAISHTHQNKNLTLENVQNCTFHGTPSSYSTVYSYTLVTGNELVIIARLFSIFYCPKNVILFSFYQFAGKMRGLIEIVFLVSLLAVTVLQAAPQRKGCMSTTNIKFKTKSKLITRIKITIDIVYLKTKYSMLYRIYICKINTIMIIQYAALGGSQGPGTKFLCFSIELFTNSRNPPFNLHHQP